MTGTKWKANDRNEFLVTELILDDHQTWVCYQNVKTQQAYSCLIDAFLSRFSKIEN